MSTQIEPGDIYWSKKGLEYPPHQLIAISREELNHGNYVIAVLVTSSRVHERMNLPNYVYFEPGTFGFTEDCVAQCEAVQWWDKSEIDFTRGRSGKLDPASLYRVRAAVAYAIGFTGN